MNNSVYVINASEQCSYLTILRLWWVLTWAWFSLIFPILQSAIFIFTEQNDDDDDEFMLYKHWKFYAAISKKLQV